MKTCLENLSVGEINMAKRITVPDLLNSVSQVLNNISRSSFCFLMTDTRMKFIPV